MKIYQLFQVPRFGYLWLWGILAFNTCTASDLPYMSFPQHSTKDMVPALTPILHESSTHYKSHILKSSDVLVPALVSLASYSDCKEDTLKRLNKNLGHHGFKFNSEAVEERSALRAVSYYNAASKHLVIGFRGTDGHYLKNILYCIAIISKGSAYHDGCYFTMLPHVIKSLTNSGFNNTVLLQMMNLLKHISVDETVLSALLTGISASRETTFTTGFIRFVIVRELLSGRLIHNLLFHLLSRAVDHADKIMNEILFAHASKSIETITLTGHSFGGFLARCVSLLHNGRQASVTFAAPGGAEFFLQHLYQQSYIERFIPAATPHILYNAFMGIEALILPRLTKLGHSHYKSQLPLKRLLHINIVRYGDVVGTFMPTDAERIVIRSAIGPFNTGSLAETIDHHHKLTSLIRDLEECPSDTET